MGDDKDNKKSDFSFDTVAVLCASVFASGGTVGNKSYEMMSALDGNRTANSFQHQFRAVLKHARELKVQLEGEGAVEGVKAKPRAPKTQKAPKTPKAKAAPKRGRNSDQIKEDDDEDAAVVGEEQDAKRPRYDFDFEDVKQEV